MIIERKNEVGRVECEWTRLENDDQSCYCSTLVRHDCLDVDSDSEYGRSAGWSDQFSISQPACELHLLNKPMLVS